jgi:8-oxo-dGTP pyrophosphatase MutT (NUDIX family)
MPQQAAVLAARRNGAEIQFCLIRRRGSDDWGIPKGMIDPGNTPEEAALIEAHEEAGLAGEIVGDSIGSYEYRKWGARFTVSVYVMRVLAEQEVWDEMPFRERRWASLVEAAAMLANHPVHALLDSTTLRHFDNV